MSQEYTEKCVSLDKMISNGVFLCVENIIGWEVTVTV